MSLITIVLATYNRPAALSVAIKSVLMQTFRDWRLLVVGDCCDESTSAVVESFPDDRISYVNLPERCGEQALPNSIGMVLSDTEYIALLNHDDVLLQDHYEIALRPMLSHRASLFAGLAAFSRYSNELPDGTRLPVFSEVNPARRNLGDVFTKGCELFEPCSTWLFNREVVKKVGLWRPSADLYRTPIEDWLLRAWRAGVQLIQPNVVTVLRMLTHYQQSAGTDAYEWDYGEHNKIGEILEHGTPAGIRQWINDELQSEAVARLPKVGFKNLLVRAGTDEEWLASRLLSPEMADVFYRTGWDAFEQYCVILQRDKGCFVSMLSKFRTGRAAPAPPDFNSLLDSARRQLQQKR